MCFCMCLRLCLSAQPLVRLSGHVGCWIAGGQSVFLSANQFWFPYQIQETTEETRWVMANRDVPECEFSVQVGGRERMRQL